MPPANRGVTPGDSIAYRQFKEGLVVWVRFEGFPWWPGVVKRRKPTDPKLDPALQATGFSTRPVEFFNAEKSRSVVDVEYIKEYTENFKLVANATTVKGGLYAKDIIAACEAANAYITRHGAHAFQRNAVALPHFVSPLRSVKLRLAGTIPVVPSSPIPTPAPTRKRTRAATARDRVEEAEVIDERIEETVVAPRATIGAPDQPHFVAARDLQPISTLPSKKRMRAEMLARHPDRLQITRPLHDRAPFSAIPSVAIAVNSGVDSASADPATSGELSTSNGQRSSPRKPWMRTRRSSAPGTSAASPVTPTPTAGLDPRTRRKRAASAEASRRIAASRRSDSLSATRHSTGRDDREHGNHGRNNSSAAKRNGHPVQEPNNRTDRAQLPVAPSGPPHEQLIRFNEERMRFNDERRRFNDERQRFNYDRQAFTEDRIRAFEENNRLQEERERAREEAQRLRDDVQRVRDEIHQGRARTLALEEREKEMKIMWEELRKENAAVVAELKKRCDEHPNFAKEQPEFYAEKKAIVERLDKEVKELEQAKEAARRDASAILAAREELRTTLDEKHKVHDSIRASHSRLLKSCQDLQKTRDMLRREIAVLQEKLAVKANEMGVDNCPVRASPDHI